jgi:hypothetical protein
LGQYAVSFLSATLAGALNCSQRKYIRCNSAGEPRSGTGNVVLPKEIKKINTLLSLPQNLPTPFASAKKATLLQMAD